MQKRRLAQPHKASSCTARPFWVGYPCLVKRDAVEVIGIAWLGVHMMEWAWKDEAGGAYVVIEISSSRGELPTNSDIH